MSVLGTTVMALAAEFGNSQSEASRERAPSCYCPDESQPRPSANKTLCHQSPKKRGRPRKSSNPPIEKTDALADAWKKKIPPKSEKAPKCVENGIVSPNRRGRGRPRKESSVEALPFVESSELKDNAQSKKRLRIDDNDLMVQTDTCDRTALTLYDTESKNAGFSHDMYDQESSNTSEISNSPEVDTEKQQASIAEQNTESSCAPYTNGRVCANCRTSVTPMWRHGPVGFDNLCNGCGVKWKRGRMPLNGAFIFQKQKAKGQALSPEADVGNSKTRSKLLPKLFYDGDALCFSGSVSDEEFIGFVSNANFEKTAGAEAKSIDAPDISQRAQFLNWALAVVPSESFASVAFDIKKICERVHSEESDLSGKKCVVDRSKNQSFSEFEVDLEKLSQSDWRDLCQIFTFHD
ncbi:hypothetical protein HDU84_002765 [Entophlyctis sp. JEL0112]|nr:hypothetical protein HDU84_002765 [Entophlyctis sp. JEL0112]